MILRRKVTGTIGVAGIGSIVSPWKPNTATTRARFRFCLNSATVSKNPLPVKEYVRRMPDTIQLSYG